MEPSNKESARLVEHLLSTLDADEETTSEELWMEEAERRHADYRAGRIASKTAEQILREPGTKLTSTAFLGPAEAEMVGAAEFYESQGSGLGKDFLDEVQRSVERIT